MDLPMPVQLSSREWQIYMIKNYVKSQLLGLVRVFQARYSSYMTFEQMEEELSSINKLVADLHIELINPGLLNNKQKRNNNSRNHAYVADDDKCRARVWGDANHLVWKLADGRTVYGNQCKRAKSIGSQYCFKHTKKLTHEDWFSEPSPTMRQHFINAINP